MCVYSCMYIHILHMDFIHIYVYTFMCAMFSWLNFNSTSKNEDHGIWTHHFMANRWETMIIVADFIFLGSKITADGD